jgi:hypothetical protein
LEIVRDGRLTLPMPEPERERVLRVKRGEVGDLGMVLAEIDQVQTAVQEHLDTGRTPLPAQPDLAAISAWAADAHREFWGWR